MIQFNKQGKKITISVWLLIEDGKNIGKSPLQKRVSEESYPFICQPAWAGKMEDGEDKIDTIKRECEEELGKEFSDSFDFSSLKFISETEDNHWVTHNFFSSVTEKQLLKVKMHKDAYPEFIFASKEDIFFPESSLKDPKNNIVLFDSQYKILKEILNK